MIFKAESAMIDALAHSLRDRRRISALRALSLPSGRQINRAPRDLEV
jgi:hypothetical protein